MTYRPALIALLALSLPLTACLKTEVTCEGDACGDAPAQTGGDQVQGTGGADPGDPGPASNALALRYADLPNVDDPTGGSSVATGGGGTLEQDPDALLVFVSDQALTCGNPYGPTDCGSHWSFSVKLPVALQQPGTYAFAVESDATHVEAFESLTGPGSGDDCYAGGGTADGGSIEVTSIDEHGVTGHLHADSFDSAIGVVDLDFFAPRCP